jgi:hypothetical protein
LHGDAVIEALRERSGDAFDLPEGTGYPVLHRWPRPGWRRASGPRPRAAGGASTASPTRGGPPLVQERSRWQELADAVAGVLKGVQPWPNPN